MRGVASASGPAGRGATVALVGLAMALALSAAWGDSITVDEPLHLASGLAPLLTGDFRLSPDHPPLARMWAALPLLVLPNDWPPPGAPGWHEGDFFRFSYVWLDASARARLLVFAARAMVVALFGSLLLAVSATARLVAGPEAALAALFVAAFDPTLLGFGHLVMTDVPLALLSLLALVAHARFAADPSPRRLALAALPVAAASLVKFSWVLLLPALGAMSLAAVVLRPGGVSFGRRAFVAAGGWLATGLFVWGAVWAAYGFRYSPYTGPDRETARMYAAFDATNRPPKDRLEAWALALNEPTTGRRRDGTAPALLARFRDARLLPEAYLYGAAFAQKKALYRGAYLLGEYSMTGWPSYFPIAFLLKTPLATLLLFGAGLTALLLGQRGPLAREEEAGASTPAAAETAEPAARSLLLLGLAVFAATVAAGAVASRLNIGHRHLLPLYPVVFVVAGAAASWRRTRFGRVLVPAAGLWLAASTLLSHPHHLAYFNELVGGPRHGHRYLADGNLDLGQDLERLAAYARERPGETIKLARFYDTPLPKGFRPEPLLSLDPAVSLAPLSAGTYVVSANELLGVYKPQVRDATWARPEVVARYRALAARAAAPAFSDAGRRARADAEEAYDALRRLRLVNRLRHRAEDARIGWSLFLFRLDQAAVDELTRP